MNKDELWRTYVKKNPSFAKEDSTEVKLTARGMRKFFDQTWEHAFRAGLDKGNGSKSLIEQILG